MKQKLTFLLTAVLLLTGLSSWGQTRDEVVAYTLEPIVGSNNSYAGNCDIEIDGITWNLTGNSTMIPWRIGGKSIEGVDRELFSKTPIADNITHIEIEHGTASGIVVNAMTLTVSLNEDFTDPVSEMEGEFAASSTTTFVRPTDADWTNMYYKVTYNVTVSGTSNKFLQFVGAVFYKEGGGPETVATPSFSPAGGTYFEPQAVTISCNTQEASIYYTTDGSEPTESSELYTEPLSITETTTLKAKAFKEDCTPSNIATATYTFPELVTIAEASGLAVDAYAMVQGVIVFIDNRNIYVQDETGAICLFLNSNTVPEGLALGDMVKAYGKRTDYNGLRELANINGGNANEFSVISTGNTLPLEVMTIADINEGASGELQCTRVKLESVTLGATEGNNTTLTQGDDEIIIYKMPVLTDIEAGDVVDVVGVVGYFNAAQIRVSFASDITLSYVPEPQLAVSVNQLSGFQYTFGAGPSQPSNFTVTGSDLDAVVAVTAPDNFEIALTEEGSYAASLNIEPAEGAVDATVYVRMQAGLAVGDYTGTVSVTCGDLSQIVALSGVVSEQPMVEAPVFTPASGTYNEPQNVTITCATEGATVYYSLMSTEGPWTAFESAITIDQSKTVWAYAEKDGYLNSSVVSAEYIIEIPLEPGIEAFMPLYIQGNNGTNNDRVPVAVAAYIGVLEPNTTYRYTNQFVDDDDAPETSGAGNVIYTTPERFYRTTNPSLSTEGGYGEFTTDEEGIGFVWFINEPTANARFTPGNHVYLRIRLNDGHDGTSTAYVLTTEDYATVLNFGTENDEYSGSAFYAKSEDNPRSFVMMFATNDDMRPTYSTSIETTGVEFADINQYADFYKEEVAGKDGWFGGILPNSNENGISVIWVVDLEGNVVNGYYATDGQWACGANTANPTGGLDEPIFIDLTYDGVGEEIVESNVKVWSAGREFVVENGDDAEYTMTVFNVLGQPMMSKTIGAGSTQHISHSLATGLYVISLQNNLNKVSIKVIVR